MGWGAEKAHRLLPKKVTQDPTPSVIGIRQKSVPDRRNCICKGREVRERREYERRLELETAGTQGSARQGAQESRVQVGPRPRRNPGAGTLAGRQCRAGGGSIVHPSPVLPFSGSTHIALASGGG